MVTKETDTGNQKQYLSDVKMANCKQNGDIRTAWFAVGTARCFRTGRNLSPATTHRHKAKYNDVKRRREVSNERSQQRRRHHVNAEESR